MTLLLGSGRLTRRTSGVGVEHMWSSPCPWPRATLSRTVRSVQQAIELWSVRGKLWHPPDGRSGRRHWGTLACADVQHALVDAAFDQRRVGHGARVGHAALQRRHREHATHTGQGGGGLASVHALLAQQSARGGKRRVGVGCAYSSMSEPNPMWPATAIARLTSGKLAEAGQSLMGGQRHSWPKTELKG